MLVIESAAAGCGIPSDSLGISVSVQDTTPQYSHPEMYDENGNPLPDEIIAFRFEGNNQQDED